ncbi:MAG: rRNA methyltransferase [Blastocatellia bacterium]|nr:rRNA methyltransferase [Blastocatellia bacterium]
MPYRLPDAIRHAIEESATGVPVAALAKASTELSESYRAPKHHGAKQHVASREQRLAYGIARAPATFGAVSAALEAVREVASEIVVGSVTDLGSGPGTAVWAAAETFPSLESASCVERDGGFIEMGRELARAASYPVASSLRWVSADLVSASIPPADLVIAAYSLSEVDPDEVEGIVERAWAASRVALVIVEPGTPAGYAAIMRYRSRLIELGAHVAAPCPHSDSCPLAEGDWCHFAARVDRSSLHRRLKGGEFGHEDEKYSYVAVTREAVTPAPARILRHPRKPPKVVELELCTTEGLRRGHVGKGQRDAWRAARDARWGDAWRF